MSKSPPLPPGSPVRVTGNGPDRRLTVDLLETVPGLGHAFAARGSDRQSALKAAAGGRTLPLHTLRQVHGARVRMIPGPQPCEPEAERPEGDALITDRQGQALGITVADCIPILICDPRRRALAAAHAGWRGTVAGVLRSTLDSLHNAYGCRPSDLRIALGPAIGRCCFEVGEEVVTALLQFDPGAQACIDPDGDRPRIDLSAANRRQAIAAGVLPENIREAGLCTFCRADLLPSFRRDGAAAGRMTALIAWLS